MTFFNYHCYLPILSFFILSFEYFFMSSEFFPCFVYQTFLHHFIICLVPKTKYHLHHQQFQPFSISIFIIFNLYSKYTLNNLQILINLILVFKPLCFNFSFIHNFRILYAAYLFVLIVYQYVNLLLPFLVLLLL